MRENRQRREAGMGGQTPVLMTDGRTRPVHALRAADRVYGSRMDGRYRRYVITEVVEHRRVHGPAHLIVLQDGTRLIAGEDQSLLSERGWKYVTGTEQGAGRRPHLTPNNSLMGVGRFAAGPQDDLDYRRGYLCGMIRGDGQIGHYPQGPSNAPSTVLHRFRLALADFEALERSRRYLTGFGVVTQEFLFSEATAARREVKAIRAQSAAAVARVEDLIRWPSPVPPEWRKGFLAGVFDAEGSCSRGILRITNSDPRILHMITDCLSHFGFRAVREGPRTPANLPVTVVRLTGGLRERLRLFHIAGPAITRKTSIEGIALKSDAPLGIASLTALGSRVPLHIVTTGTGDIIADGIISSARPAGQAAASGRAAPESAAWVPDAGVSVRWTVRPVRAGARWGRRTRSAS